MVNLQPAASLATFEELLQSLREQYICSLDHSSALSQENEQLRVAACDAAAHREYEDGCAQGTAKSSDRNRERLLGTEDGPIRETVLAILDLDADHSEPEYLPRDVLRAVEEVASEWGHQRPVTSVKSKSGSMGSRRLHFGVAAKAIDGGCGNTENGEGNDDHSDNGAYSSSFCSQQLRVSNKRSVLTNNSSFVSDGAPTQSMQLAWKDHECVEYNERLREWYDRLQKKGALTVHRLESIVNRVRFPDQVFSSHRMVAVLKALNKVFGQDLQDSGDAPDSPKALPGISTLDDWRASSNSFLMKWTGNGTGLFGDLGFMIDDSLEMSYEVFNGLIVWNELQNHISDPVTAVDASVIRDCLIKYNVDEMVSEHGRIPIPEELERPHLILRILDVASACVILVNAITIGLSTEMEWTGFQTLEGMFTLFFLIEIIIKLLIHGCRQFVCGKDFLWNLFDSFIVMLAVADAMLDYIVRALQQGVSGESALGNFTLVRLARLARLTRLMRLLRLLRLRCFKELMLMVRGVLAGFRTLLWAMVLLLFLVYTVAVLLVQTVGVDAIVVHEAEGPLFSSLQWSMFNVFRLFLSDGSLLDGTPLVSHLYQVYKGIFMVPYALVLLFINFGIFNLITAIFVENVTENARQKRKLTSVEDRMLMSQKLRAMMLACCGYKFWERSAGATFRNHSEVSQTRKSFGRWSVSSNDNDVSEIEWPDPDDDGVLLTSSDVQVTRAMFEAAVEEERVKEILDDLEVQIGDRAELFDVLDADNSGAIDIKELITGLMKMRSGGADKSDAVATVLGIRAIQMGMRDMRHQAAQNHEQIALMFPRAKKQIVMPSGT